LPRTHAVEPENAPEKSKPLIEEAKKAAGGQVVNFHRQMAVAPAAFKGYLDLAGTLAGGALSRKDQEAIAIAISDKHGCTY
jgi:alkylhydroperoxidase family enzyme